MSSSDMRKLMESVKLDEEIISKKGNQSKMTMLIAEFIGKQGYKVVISNDTIHARNDYEQEDWDIIIK
jgi:hypothetical protein